jgi:hypothetical protein
MEFAIAAGLAGLGYSLSKKENIREKNGNETPLNSNNIPNSQELINSNHLKTVSDQLRTRSETNWEESKKPNETGIIPANFNKDFQDISNLNGNDATMSLYSSNFSNGMDQYQDINNELEKDNNKENPDFYEAFYSVNNHASSHISNIENPNPEGHNNMVPFFGGSIKQNTRINQHETTLDLFTGTERLKPKKHEVENMFNPEKDIGKTNGVGVSYNNERERFVSSNYQQGIKPFQSVNVGPGLNQGPTANGDIGFHDSYRPPVKTVDQLRVNKKVTYEGRIKPAKAVVSNRGKTGKMFKNLPEKFYKKTLSHLFKTTGAFTKERQREKYILKDQNRKVSKTVQGSAGPVNEIKHEARSKVQKDKRNTLKETGKRHLAASGQWTTKEQSKGGNDPSDYGKSGFKTYPNERLVTSERTVTSNLKGEVSKPKNPLTDKAKGTKKELYSTYSRKGNARLRGSGEHTVQHSQPLKTTVKETLIHDARDGSMAPQRPSKITLKDRKNDTAKTTMKETLVHNNRNGNVNTEKKNIVYDKENWKTKTTLRQVYPNGKYGSIKPETLISGEKKGKAYNPKSTAKTTIRETTENNKHKGTLVGKSGLSKHITYDPKDVAKTTTKETTEERKYTGQAGQEVLQRGMGYITANKSATAPNTNRQFTSDRDYTGITGGVETSENGYKVFNATAQNTNRQFTSDNEYTGGAESSSKAQMSYQDKYNAQLNALKEVVSKGRAPTLSSTKVAVGGGNVIIEPRKKVSIEEKIHQPGLSKIYSNTASETAHNCQITKIPNSDDEDIIANRIEEPELLKAFKENPYTQPLNSVA